MAEPTPGTSQGSGPKTTTLDKAQVAVAQKIIAAGNESCFPIDTINFAVKIAFLESSLGNALSNGIPGNTSTGLYQYNDGQWRASGGGGEKSADDAQIAAFYGDIRKYSARYNSLMTTSPATLAGISLYQYIYIKHHDGPSYDKPFAQAPGKLLYDASTFVAPKEARVDAITPCKAPAGK